MVLKIFFLFREAKYLFLTLAAFLLLYFGTMDLVLYEVFQNTTLIEESRRVIPRVHSPFHPLTVKLLTLDHFSHYFIKPTAELFNHVTDLSNVIVFITPNMISATHVVVGIVVGKFVSSESLRQRRIGALLYELRSWLDGLDGAVYRSRLGNTLYTTHGESIINVDNVCDVIGGTALCLGVLFYLLKAFTKSESLPVLSKNGKSDLNASSPAAPKKRDIVVKVALYGTLTAVAGRTWELQVSHAETLFEKQLTSPEATAVQTVLLHSCATWWLFWSWRLIGQTLFHYLVIAILLDKVWEFLSYAWYIGGFMVLLLNVASFCHFSHVGTLLSLQHA